MSVVSPHRTALVAGATGAIGKVLLQQLLDDSCYSSVKVLTRRPLGFTHPKLQELRLGEGSVASHGRALQADDVFCCLGTTMQQAGSRAAFERVDYHLVLEVARAAQAQGAQQFLVVSALGASLRSPSFYSRVKARMERAVQDLGYPTVQVLRPSLLLTRSRPDSRPAEWLAMQLAPAINPLLNGPLKAYRAIRVEAVAEAMITLARRQAPGRHIHTLPLAA